MILNKEEIMLNLEKELTAYRKVAKEALINWNDMDQLEADKLVRIAKFNELDGQVWANGSMTAASLGFAKYLLQKKGSGLSVQNISEITNLIANAMGFKGGSWETEDCPYATSDHQQLLLILSEEFKTSEPEELILDVLTAVHNDWVTSNDKKFNREGREHQRFQHLPLEMIGWKETIKDLIFVKPMLEALNIELNMDKLQKAYEERVRKFLISNEFITKEGQTDKEKIVQTIMQGQDFYSALTENNTATTEEIAIQMCDQSLERIQDVPVK